MNNTDFPSFDVFNNTLKLVEAVRDGNQQEFDRLLLSSNIDLMDHAVIHVAAQFNRQEMLNILLPLAQTIENPQGLLWSIEQNNYDVVAMLAPYMHQNALGEGLRFAEANNIIDAIAAHIDHVNEHLAKDLSTKENPHIFEALHAKMSERVIRAAVFGAVKNNNISVLKTLMDLHGDLFAHYNGNDYTNIVFNAVGSSLETLNAVLPYCDKNMYYKALRRSVSFDKYEHTKVLAECHTYTNDEILDVVKICGKRNDTQFASHVLNHYPIAHSNKAQLLECAVRNNDQILFDTLFKDVDCNNSQDVNACHLAAWWASKRGYNHYLATLAQKIDLNVSLETMYNDTAHKFKEEHFETLRDFLAQQQNQKIVAHIDAVGAVGRRKM